MKTLLFGIALFFSALTVASFISDLVDAVVNRRNANYKNTVFCFGLSVSLWTSFYHLTQV